MKIPYAPAILQTHIWAHLMLVSYEYYMRWLTLCWSIRGLGGLFWSLSLWFSGLCNLVFPLTFQHVLLTETFEQVTCQYAGGIYSDLSRTPQVASDRNPSQTMWGSDTLPVLCLRSLASICPRLGWFSPQSNKKYHKSPRFLPRDHIWLILTGPRSKCLRKFSGWPSLRNMSTPRPCTLSRKTAFPEGRAKEQTLPICF